MTNFGWQGFQPNVPFITVGYYDADMFLGAKLNKATKVTKLSIFFTETSNRCNKR